MSDTAAIVRSKIDGAGKLKTVVRTMKAMAAASIGQYENAVLALADYERTVTSGLTVCLRTTAGQGAAATRSARHGKVGAIVFGSDQGLVGQFNETIAASIIDTLNRLPGEKKIWVVGERLHARLAESGLPLAGLYLVPGSVSAIAALVGQIQIDIEAHHLIDDFSHVFLFHNQPQSGSRYQPACQPLLPLDAHWQHTLANAPWPGPTLPEAIGGHEQLLRDLVREYLFISLYKACAGSLASENASRLAAMQRAEKNIDALAEQLQRRFYRLRQTTIDAELFDVITGYLALTPEHGTVQDS